MTGVQIRMEDEAVNAAIERVAKAGGDTGALMDEFAGAMLYAVERRFETETDPQGRPWAPLSPRTAAKRVRGRKRGREHTLRVSGLLYQSITGEASSREAAVGTNLVYAAIHHKGGTIGIPERSATVIHQIRGRQGEQRLGRFAKRRSKRAMARDVAIGAHSITIPARPYLGFSDEDRARLLEIAERHFRDAIHGAAS